MCPWNLIMEFEGYLAFVSVRLSIVAMGLVGNASCLVILLQKQMGSSYSYLLLGVTISDALSLILSAIWSFDIINLINLEIQSSSLHAFLYICAWIGAGGTKYFTMAISIERFVAVCFPLKAKQLLNSKTSKIFAFSVFAFVITLAIGSFLDSLYFEHQSYEIYAVIVIYLSPIAVFFILNGFTFSALYRFKKQRQTLTESEEAEISVTRMLLTEVFVFGLFYSFEVTNIFLEYLIKFEELKYRQMINLLAEILCDINSSVDVVIYYVMGTNFRAESIRLFKKCTYLISGCK